MTRWLIINLLLPAHKSRDIGKANKIMHNIMETIIAEITEKKKAEDKILNFYEKRLKFIKAILKICEQ